ncbi:unnamed protein product, partial [Didymodactylos carnosus]
IRDGVKNCVSEDDESTDELALTTCSNIRRHRFRCSIEEPACLSVTSLGNHRDNCRNSFDELWMGTNMKLSNMNCNSESTLECGILRQYIEASWISIDKNQSSVQFKLPFRAYCDTFWNLPSHEDENSTECQKSWVCLEEQWQCHTGQCIDKNWVLDGEWDCPDASDEEAIFDWGISDRNAQVIQLSVLEEKFYRHHGAQPFSAFCNLSEEFPCLRADMPNELHNFTHYRPCINRRQIGDGRVDCYGAIDERNTLPSCHRPTMLGYYFTCLSHYICISYSKHCSPETCRDISNDHFWCDRFKRSFFDGKKDFVCINGSDTKGGRCNRIWNCPFGEDEYMCDYENKLKQVLV